MSTLVLCPAPVTRPVPPRRRVHPALIVLVLAITGVLVCLVAVVFAVLAAPGPALLTAGVLAVAGWLVHTATTAPLPLLLALAVAGVVAPWLLLVAVLACLALARGGLR